MKSKHHNKIDLPDELNVYVNDPARTGLERIGLDRSGTDRHGMARWFF
jgi:hypothetical protein